MFLLVHIAALAAHGPDFYSHGVLNFQLTFAGNAPVVSRFLIFYTCIEFDASPPAALKRL